MHFPFLGDGAPQCDFRPWQVGSIDRLHYHMYLWTALAVKIIYHSCQLTDIVINPDCQLTDHLYNAFLSLSPEQDIVTHTLPFDGCCTATLSSAHCQGPPALPPTVAHFFLFGESCF